MASAAQTIDLKLPAQGFPAVESMREERVAALDDLLSMCRMLHDLYEKVGGSEEWHRNEQAAWNESALA